MFRLKFFNKFDIFSDDISSNSFYIFFSLSSPSEITIMCILINLMVSKKSLRIVSFFFITFFFLLHALDNFYWIIYKFTDFFSFCQLKLFESLSWIFACSYCVFQLRISIWFFLDIIFLCLYSTLIRHCYTFFEFLIHIYNSWF